jgi:hypothetical protein
MKGHSLCGGLCLIASVFFPLRQLLAQTLPTVSPSSNAPFCAGANNLLLTENGGNAVAWSWSGPNGFSAAVQSPVIPSPGINAAGTYRVTVTDMGGLTNTGEIQVLIYPSPAASTSDVYLCQGATANMQGSGGVQCQWQPATGLSDAQLCTPVVSTNVSTLYTLKVTDTNGCTATAQSQVWVHQPQGLSCNDQITISLDASGQITLTPEMILEGSVDASQFYTVNVLDNTGIQLGNTVGCAQLGQTLTVRVTDICTGNSCWGTLKLEDKIKPTVSCPGFKIPCVLTNYDPAVLQTTYGITQAFPVSTDNCTVTSTSHTDFWFDLDCDQGLDGDDVTGFLQRTWTVKDQSGNQTLCYQIIAARRLKISDLTLPPMAEVPCESPNTATAVTGAPSITFNGIQLPLYPNPGSCEMDILYFDKWVPVCDGTKNLIRTWLIFNDCLPNDATNPKEYKQLIKVNDNKGPTMTCPANLTVSTDPFQCCASVDLPDLVIQENCSRVNNLSALITTYDPDSIAPTGNYVVNGQLTTFPNNNLWTSDTLGILGLTPCLPTGAHTVTYRAQDDCGNQRTCSFILKVSDLTPPAIACDEITQVALTIDGVAEVQANTFDDGSFDLCCALLFEARRMGPECNDTIPDDFGPLVRFCCQDIGDTIGVVLRAKDCHNNQNECMVQVVVEDKTKPACVPPAQANVNCENFDPSLWAYGAPNISDNCCLDTLIHSVNYNQFDTICNRGTIIRQFRVFDCYGNSAQCTQRVVVEYAQDYFVKFPNDVIIKKCDGTGNYGAPQFFQNDCELVGISFQDEIINIVPDACYQIERTWKVINWCTYNPQLPCVGVPNPEPTANPLDPNNIRGPVISPPNTNGAWGSTIVSLTPGTPPVNFSQYYQANANCYTYIQHIKIVDLQDPIINVTPGEQTLCDLTANDAALWNETQWWENSTNSHNLCEGPADVQITAIDSCTGTDMHIRYLLFLDTDQDGNMETVINSDLPPPAGEINVGNANNPNFEGGTPRRFDQRNVPANQKYRFALEKINLPNGLVQASLRWNTPAATGMYTIPELPYGTHKIKWIAQDGCGNETVKEYNLIVKDCKKPTVVCLNGLSINNMINGEATLWVGDFLQYAEDNCTPPALLRLAVRKQGAGAGFPFDNTGNPQQSITFNCTELGLQPVEVWAMDLAGNADFCVTYVLVQDNAGNCPQSAAKVSGFVVTETPDGLENASIGLSGNSPTQALINLNTLTNDKGAYAFENLPLQSNFTILPEKDDNPLNGVSTYDLVLVSKHILGIQPLNSPWKMIAADVNRSGSITNFDIVELRKLILGIYTELPGNTSWRFVDKHFTFPNPLNPFQTTFPESISIDNFPFTTKPFEFTAIKIGDVNGTALPNSLDNTLDRSEQPPVAITATATHLQAGETCWIEFHLPEGPEACQLTLEMPEMDILAIQPLQGITADQVAVFPDKQALTLAWDGSGNVRFGVQIRARQSLHTGAAIRISSRITRAKAYEAGVEKPVYLHFEKNIPDLTANQSRLEAVQPNPFSTKTRVQFYCPRAGTARVQVCHADGRQLWSQQKNVEQGLNVLELNAADWPVSNGVLYCRIETASGILTEKLILHRL